VKKKKPKKQPARQPQAVVQPQQQALYHSLRERVEEHVHKALQLERSPMALIRLALAAHHTCQDSHQSLDPAALQRLACQSGCDYCCHPPVSAAVPEVANIAAYIQSQLPQAEQQRLTQRVEQVYARVHPLSGEERAALSLACPFLEAGRCSIYPVRPLACRGHNSTSRQACQKVFEQPSRQQLIPSYVPLMASAQGLKEGLVAGLQRAGLKSPLVDLVRASHKLLGELDDNLEDWLSGGDTFADCQPF
jgi:Fe-S-cluster containining protein